MADDGDNKALLLQLSADVRTLERSWRRANGVVDTGGRQMEKRAFDVARNIEKSLGDIKLPRHLAREFNSLGEGIGRSLLGVSRGAQLALAGVSAYAIKLAADAAEIESAFDVAFKGASRGARDFSDVLSKRVGRDAVETRQAMTRLQLVLTGTGVAAEQAAEMTKKLAEVGIDAGSLFNTSDAEAFQKIISGLSGEAEPLKAFGVVINEAAVKAELLRLGFKGNASAASEAAKSIARANLIIKGLAVAQGDATRTAGSAANQTRALRAEANAAARDLGGQLLPTYVKVVRASADMLKGFNALPDGVQVAGLAILAFIAAGGPIGGLLANLARVISLAKATRAAIAGIAAANTAAGVTGAGAGAGTAAGAAAGAGLGGLAAAGVATAGVGLVGVGATSAFLSGRQYQRTIKAVDKATDEALAAAVNTARGDLTRIAKSNPGEGARETVALLNKQLASLTAEQARRQVAAAAGKPGAAAGAEPPATVQGGFSLSPTQQAGTGVGKGKAGRKGAAAPRDLNDEQIAQIAAQIAAADRDVLQARLQLADTAQARADLEKQIVGEQQAQEDARLDEQIAATRDAKGITEATRAQRLAALESLKLRNAEVADLQRQAIDREAGEQQAQDALSLKQAELDGQAEALSLQEGLARTAKERRRIEIAMLDLAERRAQAEVDAISAVKGTTSLEYQIAAQRLADLKATRGQRTAAIDQQTAGPLQSYFDDLPRDVDEVNEAMQRLEAEGISNVVDGVARVAAGMGSLKDVARGVIQDLTYQFTKLNLEAGLGRVFGKSKVTAGGAPGAGPIGTVADPVYVAVAGSPGGGLADAAAGAGGFSFADFGLPQASTSFDLATPDGGRGIFEAITSGQAFEPLDGFVGDFSSLSQGFTADLSSVFRENTTGGFISALTGAFSSLSSFGSIGGGGGSGSGLLSLASAGLKLFSAFGGGGGGLPFSTDFSGLSLPSGFSGFGYAGGGEIRGPGTGTSDSIPIWASDGEHMIRAAPAKRYRNLLEMINSGQTSRVLDMINAGRVPHMKLGGLLDFGALGFLGKKIGFGGALGGALGFDGGFAGVIPQLAGSLLKGGGGGDVSNSFTPTINMYLQGVAGQSDSDLRRTGRQVASAALAEMARARKSGIGG